MVAVHTAATDCVKSHTSFKLHVWHEWFRAPFSKGQVLPYCLNRATHVSAVARLFFGAHDLAIEVGRHTNAPRDQRTCSMCREAVEDECHFLLECPAYNDLRVVQACAPAFAKCTEQESWRNMRLVTQAGNDKHHWMALAEFVIRAEARRREHRRSRNLT